VLLNQIPSLMTGGRYLRPLQWLKPSRSSLTRTEMRLKKHLQRMAKKRRRSRSGIQLTTSGLLQIEGRRIYRSCSVTTRGSTAFSKSLLLKASVQTNKKR
jgi:hypothetical protein